MEAVDDSVKCNPPLGVCLGVEEDFSHIHIVYGGLAKISVHQVVEVLFGQQDIAGLVVHVQEVLQVLQEVGGVKIDTHKGALKINPVPPKKKHNRYSKMLITDSQAMGIKYLARSHCHRESNMCAQVIVEPFTSDVLGKGS